MIKLKSMLTELTQHQKELKKDYLFQQSKLRSSNAVPSWTEMWKSILHSDGVKDVLRDMRDDVLRDGGSDSDFDEKEAIEQVEDEQRHRYFEIVQEYKHIDGDRCWREIVIPRQVDPRRLTQIGVYWAITDTAAEAHWAGHSGKPKLNCIYEGVINTDIVDWAGTMFARMDYSLGDMEQEIRFLKNSKLFVKYVKVYNDMEDGVQIHQLNREIRL
jgi:hypothetical protein